MGERMVRGEAHARRAFRSGARGGSSPALAYAKWQMVGARAQRRESRWRAASSPGSTAWWSEASMFAPRAGPAHLGGAVLPPPFPVRNLKIARSSEVPPARVRPCPSPIRAVRLRESRARQRRQRLQLLSRARYSARPCQCAPPASRCCKVILGLVHRKRLSLSLCGRAALAS
jgi:hypothetical protein